MCRWRHCAWSVLDGCVGDGWFDSFDVRGLKIFLLSVLQVIAREAGTRENKEH